MSNIRTATTMAVAMVTAAPKVTYARRLPAHQPQYPQRQEQEQQPERGERVGKRRARANQRLRERPPERRRTEQHRRPAMRTALDDERELALRRVRNHQRRVRELHAGSRERVLHDRFQRGEAELRRPVAPAHRQGIPALLQLQRRAPIARGMQVQKRDRARALVPARHGHANGSPTRRCGFDDDRTRAAVWQLDAVDERAEQDAVEPAGARNDHQQGTGFRQRGRSGVRRGRRADGPRGRTEQQHAEQRPEARETRRRHAMREEKGTAPTGEARAGYAAHGVGDRIGYRRDAALRTRAAAACR
jgi:hypothetical protein